MSSDIFILAMVVSTLLELLVFSCCSHHLVGMITITQFIDNTFLDDLFSNCHKKVIIVI
jgi:hypothetical protein